MNNSIKYTAPIFLGTFMVLGYRNMQYVTKDIQKQTNYQGRFHCNITDVKDATQLNVDEIYKKNLDALSRK